MARIRPKATIVALATCAVALTAMWQHGAASTSGTIDLASYAPTSHIFGVQNTEMGQSVATGDFNGDGVQDILVGAVYADRPDGKVWDNPGNAYVILGSRTLPGVIDLATGGAAMTILGDDRDDHLGTPAAAGDFNGDGYDDVVVAARNADGPGAGSCLPYGIGDRCEAGVVYIVFGSAGLSGTVDTRSAQQGVTIYGADAGDLLPGSIAVGDVNHDGIDDLLLGTVDAGGPANARSKGGDAYVIFGSPTLGGVIDLASTPANVTIYGAEAGDKLGYGLASGDFNGDGTDDILVTAQWADGPGNVRSLAGEAYVIFGSRTLPAVIDIAAAPQDFTIYGIEPQDKVGNAAAGDLNGDGVDDVLVVASEADGALNAKLQAGDAYAVFGPLQHGGVVDIGLSQQDLTIYGADKNDKLAQQAYALAVGDFNGDGADDILAGSTAADGPGTGACPDGGTGDRCTAGDAYVIFGRPTLSGTIDLASLQGGVTIYGGTKDDQLGPAAAGDVNGDGTDEVLVAAPYADGVNELRPACGEVYVISSGDTDHDGLPDFADPCPNTADCDADLFNDYIETSIGTDPLDACPDNLNDPAWPLDQDNSTQVNVLDMLMYKPKLHAPYDRRYDLNVDGAVNVLDMLMYKGRLGKSCTNP